MDDARKVLLHIIGEQVLDSTTMDYFSIYLAIEENESIDN